MPMPLPFTVWLSSIVGLGEVLQHTPRAVTVEPPSVSTRPPEVAEVEVIWFTALVDTEGRKAFACRKMPPGPPSRLAIGAAFPAIPDRNNDMVIS